MTTSVLLIIASLGLLYFGAEWLVNGASSVALRLGLTPLVVGLTVVAYGTSTPEMIVSTKAALVDQGAIAIGNVVGSNIFNIAVILGLAALVCPMKVQWQLLKLDAPIMVLAAVAFIFLFRDGRIDRLEAGLFAAAAVIYTVGNVWLARRQTSAAVVAEFAEAVPAPTRHWALDVGLILGGLAVLVAGSRLLVDNSISMARSWGVSEAVIGLTIVAAGTSMPELATSIVAALKKQPDIALGNVIGSNIFNIFAILGVSGVIAPMDGPGIKSTDLYVMLGLAAVLVPILWTGRTVSRLEGGVLVAIYGGYLYHLWPK